MKKVLLLDLPIGSDFYIGGLHFRLCVKLGNRYLVQEYESGLLQESYSFAFPSYIEVEIYEESGLAIDLDGMPYDPNLDQRNMLKPPRL